MLILTRRPGESVLIQDDISVTVTHIDGGQVKLGISAPKHIRVLREEISRSVTPPESANTGPDRPRRKFKLLTKPFRKK